MKPTKPPDLALKYEIYHYQLITDQKYFSRRHQHPTQTSSTYKNPMKARNTNTIEFDVSLEPGIHQQFCSDGDFPFFQHFQFQWCQSATCRILLLLDQHKKLQALSLSL